jgi:hypothetical protein
MNPLSETTANLFQLEGVMQLIEKTDNESVLKEDNLPARSCEIQTIV